MKRKIICLVCCISLLALVSCGKTYDDPEDPSLTTEIEEETEEDTTETNAASNEEVTEDKTTEEETTGEEASEENTEDGENAKSDNSQSQITVDEAEKILTESLGSVDEETGNTYSFGYMDTVTVDGAGYYVFNWSRMVDNHLSTLGDIFVATDGSAVYEGVYNAIGDCEVYTDYNYK